ncbi:general stress protein 26 [Roseiarcus fermentans]|uniref:General stress protein 26 n=1 Tax=Roseiarcus fermentans TaxID=1473586 RepID=A0A366F9R0_9HYPH|nr:pyridoxamine 5'-phosphate oxidase family protein [Roseiarcus fermentans]RBP11348.1 general stress protein 26 [Roseiarcus fermentans]
MSEISASAESGAERLLDAAAALIAAAPFCWLATPGEGGSVSARPMGRLSPHPRKTNWTLSFVTDGRSRKSVELRHADRVTLVFDGATRSQFAALSGVAKICAGRDEVESRWRPDFDQYFPTRADRQNAVFVDVAADRMELWIKGVTPEPFGMRTTVLLREADGRWRML